MHKTIPFRNKSNFTGVKFQRDHLRLLCFTKPKSPRNPETTQNPTENKATNNVPSLIYLNKSI